MSELTDEDKETALRAWDGPVTEAIHVGYPQAVFRVYRAGLAAGIASERERCARICEARDLHRSDSSVDAEAASCAAAIQQILAQYMTDAYKAGVATERERCARICETAVMPDIKLGMSWRKELAAAIRRPTP